MHNPAPRRREQGWRRRGRPDGALRETLPAPRRCRLPCSPTPEPAHARRPPGARRCRSRTPRHTDPPEAATAFGLHRAARRRPHPAARPRVRPAARCPHHARGHDLRLRCFRRGRRLALEGFLRGGRGRAGAVPPALRPRHAARGRRRSRRHRRHAAHAGDPGGAGALPDPPLGGAAQVSAVLDAAAAGLRRIAGRDDPPRRHRARTLGRHRDAGGDGATRARHRTRRRAAPQRDRRRPRGPPHRAVSGLHRHPPQRGVDPGPLAGAASRPWS